MSSTIKIKAPAMPEPVANVSASDPVRGIGFVKPDKSYFTADQLAARDAQWQEMYGPVVEALEEIMADMDSDFGTGYDYDKARAALSAITKD